MADKGRVAAIVDDRRITGLETRSALIDAGITDEVMPVLGSSVAGLPKVAVAVSGLRPSDAPSFGDAVEVPSRARCSVVVHTSANDQSLIHETPLNRCEAEALAVYASGAKPLVVARRRERRFNL